MRAEKTGWEPLQYCTTITILTTEVYKRHHLKPSKAKLPELSSVMEVNEDLK